MHSLNSTALSWSGRGYEAPMRSESPCLFGTHNCFRIFSQPEIKTRHIHILSLTSALKMPGGMRQMVVAILDMANSSYLAPFNVLSQRIKEGSIEANNNLKFLESITARCQNVRLWLSRNPCNTLRDCMSIDRQGCRHD